jgi:hypothetical protein
VGKRVGIVAWCSALGLVLALVVGAGPAVAGGPCPGCSGSYGGTWTGTYNAPNSSSDGGTTTTTISIKWSATLKWDAADRTDVWDLKTANGTFSVSGSPMGQDDCSTSLSPGPNFIVRGEVFWAAIGPGNGPVPTSSSIGKYWTMFNQPPMQWGQSGGVSNPLRSSNPMAGTECAVADPGVAGIGGAWSADLGGPRCHYDSKHFEDWVAFPVGTTGSSHEVCTSNGSDSLGNSWTGSLTTDVTFNSPGSPGSTGSPGTQRTLTPIKQDAKQDFAKAWDDAKGPCSQLAMSLGVLATGAVWLGTSATVPGGLPAGGAVLATGQVMAGASSALCGPKLKRLLDDYRVFNDPPDQNFTRLAGVARTHAPKVRACKRLAAKVLAFCLQLTPLVGRLIRATDHTTAVDDALVTTVNRASGAKRAHNGAAFAMQLAHARQLERSLSEALGGEASIGRKIARLLPSGALTPAQVRATTSYLKRRLAGRGISARAVGRIDPAASIAAPEDPITRLVAP